MPESIDLTSFEETLYLKIADVNKNPTASNFKTKIVYGKTERKSSQTRIFKTIGDMGYQTYFDSCVKPTLKKYSARQRTLPASEIKIDHNNVSHTKKLGLIMKEKRNYTITPLGEKYKKGEIKDADLFKRQMLRYFSSLEDNNKERILFPYRACLKILLEVKEINFHEFTFGIFPLYDSSETSVQQAISDIEYLRGKYPNLYVINEANRKSILDELNEFYDTKYSETDIWGLQPTTVKNQFIYIRDHLSLFSEFIKIENRKIILIEKNQAKARHLLSLDNRLEFEKNHETLLSKYIQPFLSFVIFTI